MAVVTWGGGGTTDCAGQFLASLDLFVSDLFASFLIPSSASGAGPTSAPPLALVSGRGQEKSSARPGCATIASPQLSTRVASGSASPFRGMACGTQEHATLAAAVCTERNDRADGGARNGGPFRGRLLIRTGNATGRTWVVNTRRNSCST